MMLNTRAKRYGVATGNGGAPTLWRQTSRNAVTTVPRDTREGLHLLPYSLQPHSPGWWAMAHDLAVDLTGESYPAEWVRAVIASAVLLGLIERGSAGVATLDIATCLAIAGLEQQAAPRG